MQGSILGTAGDTLRGNKIKHLKASRGNTHTHILTVSKQKRYHQVQDDAVQFKCIKANKGGKIKACLVIQVTSGSERSLTTQNVTFKNTNARTPPLEI